MRVSVVIGGYCEREMTGERQVLLELICYASGRGKPAILNLRPEKITELCMQGLIELREDGYWITEHGRGQCAQPTIPEQASYVPTKAGDVWQVHEIPPRQAPVRVDSGLQSAFGDLSAAWRRLVRLR